MIVADRFRVRWTHAAVNDLVGIAETIAEEAPLNAERVIAKLEGAAASLEHFPGRGRVVPELAQFGITAWRELLVKPYRLIHRVTATQVYIVAVFDGRRDLEDLLFERLIRSHEE